MRIKVLHVVSVDKPNYYLTNLSDFSESDEVEHSFVTFADQGNDFTRDVERRGLKVRDLGCTTRRSYPRAFREVIKLIDSWTPDIVHTHLFDPSLIGLRAARRKGIGTVLTRHHSDAIHSISSSAKRRFYLALESYINRTADHIIAPSQMVRNILVATEGVPDEKVSLIPYGQTTERFEVVTPSDIDKIKAELGIGGDRLVFVCTSRLFHRKGHKYLFEAFAELKEKGLQADLVLIGNGDHRGQLELLAQKLSISDDVKFLGWRDDALTIIAAADVVVHPSLEDALSSAVIEAVMLERPVVATDISGVRDSLGDGRFGEIVQAADADSFRIGIERILRDLDGARVRAGAGKQYLLDYMDAKRVASEHLFVYRKVLGSTSY